MGAKRSRINVGVPALALVLAIGLAGTGGARAGEEPEHRFLIYALALGAGFSPEDSRTIADASWSQDTNQATVAFRSGDIRATIAEAVALTRNPSRIRLLMQDDAALDRELLGPAGALRRVASTAFVHSIVHDPRRLRGADPQAKPEREFRPEDAYIRASLDASYHRFLREQQQGLRASGEAPARVHQAGLLIAGQYIHQFLDAYSHPENPVLGHGPSGHLPDWAWNDPPRYKTGALWTLKELKLLRAKLETTDERGALFQLAEDAGQKKFADAMVDAIIKGYDKNVFQKRLRKLIAYLPSELTDDGERQFTEALEQALNASDQRRHPTFRIAVPGYSKVDYQLGDDGRMRVSYGRTGVAVTLDDFVRWTRTQPQAGGLWRAVRADVRGKIRDYPARARARLEKVRADLRELDARLHNARLSMESFRKGRDEVDAMRRAGSLPIPTVDLDVERVEARRVAGERAAEEHARAAEEAERAKRRQERADSRGDRNPPRGGIDHGEVRNRICRGVGVLCN